MGRCLTTFWCRTQAIEAVFIRGVGVGTRPNARISLTINAPIHDGEGAARIRSARYAAHAVSLPGGAMVRRAYRQRSLVEVLLPDADKLWDATLRHIDTLLDDEVLVDCVAEALAHRHPQSRRRGRLGTPATVVLRILVLKHLSDWSFDECEREVRGSLVYRAFCRIDGERVPDAKTLIRLAHVLDEPVLKDVLARLVALGRERRVVRGRRLRVDTTVVETNIHYPTDATLLADSVRVLTRSLRQMGERVRDRTRSVARRVFEIAQRSRTAGHRRAPEVRARSQAKMKILYQGLLRITRTVVRQAERVVARARRASHAGQLSTIVDLARRVLAQTRARVLRGDTHYPDKVVSLFEPHTDIIRKGKLTKPTEFGRLVKIQEAEAQFITDYAVCARRQAERTLWEPGLDRHIELFDGPPQLAVADGGFASAANERAAHERGVRHVVLPRQPRDTRSRRARLALRWRTGSEGRISALKRRHGLRRCRYRGESGMQRWVGLGVIANNLLVLGRAGP
jgi:IS5 family transposase